MGVCIDQSNDGEKTHQVAFMSSIYDRGSQTLVWLGESGDRNGYIHSSCRETGGCVEHALDLIKSVNRYIEDEFERLGQDSGEDDVWDGIDRIFSMPKTKRLARRLRTLGLCERFLSPALLFTLLGAR